MAKKTKVFHIDGMTCTSCEVIIERKIKKLDGVTEVEVTHSSGACEVTTSGAEVKRSDIEKALSDTEYRLVENKSDIHSSVNWKHLLKIGVIILIIYFLVSTVDILSFDTAVNDSLSYGAIFLIGLIASVSSCLAVVGGLVLTFTATAKRMNPASSKWQLLRTQLFFNGGRLISYFLLGGIVAIIGSAVAPSPRIMGLITLVAALVMVLLALDLLGLSGSKKWIPRMPKQWSHWIHDMAEREEWWIPFALGGLTFFLPCGFTQSMQLYVLTTGSFMHGALTLFVFALGTLPALLGIGAVASFASSKGRSYRWFMLIAGCIVLLLGLYNIKNSLNLLGVNTTTWFKQSADQSASTKSIVADDVQIVEMAVNGFNYIPSKIAIQKDVPVQWVIDGSGATGCTSVIVIPSLGISKNLKSSGKTTLEFTPTKLGVMPFTCGMGMAYGEFEVVDELPESDPSCDSSTQTCTNPS